MALGSELWITSEVSRASPHGSVHPNGSQEYTDWLILSQMWAHSFSFPEPLHFSGSSDLGFEGVSMECVQELGCRGTQPWRAMYWALSPVLQDDPQPERGHIKPSWLPGDPWRTDSDGGAVSCPGRAAILCGLTSSLVLEAPWAVGSLCSRSQEKARDSLKLARRGGG